jgi:hypothetical protein
MNHHRSNSATIVDGVRQDGTAPDSSSDKDLPTPNAEEEAFDHHRFPDGFYPGVIVVLDQVRGRGVIRSYSGREVRFEFPFVSVVGAALRGRSPGIDLLHQGDTVGFDVGWTSKGLRVTTIKPADKRPSSQ